LAPFLFKKTIEFVVLLKRLMLRAIGKRPLLSS